MDSRRMLDTENMTKVLQVPRPGQCAGFIMTEWDDASEEATLKNRPENIRVNPWGRLKVKSSTTCTVITC